MRSEIGGRFVERARDASQAGDHVVVDDHDAEGRVADHDRQQRQVDAGELERGVQRDAGDDPGQRQRQHQQQRHRLTAEEPEPMDAERCERPEDESDARRHGRAS